jgi:CDP-diacylglycerol--serine O-phosphatidyltransferase
MKLRNLMFVLPNLFTVSSIFCGFYAMTLSGNDASPAQLYQAALAIFFAMFFDGFDGRVARLTKTQSQFGMELDSLADVVAFGVAPALLVYRWALQGLGVAGLVVAFLFAACGALRLARFNVLAIRNPHGGGSSFFVGMPIPFAAFGIICMVFAFQNAVGGPLPEAARWPVLGVVLFLSLLMVSTVRYRTFKNVRFSRKSAAVALGILAFGLLLAARTHPVWVLVAYFALYLVSGMIESLFLLRRYLVEQKRAALDAVMDTVDGDASATEEGEDEIDEQEVL